MICFQKTSKKINKKHWINPVFFVIIKWNTYKTFLYMKKLLFIFLACFFYFGNISLSFAHPLDISVSNIYINKTQLKTTTYFHTFEIEYLLKKNGINPDWVNYYFENQDILKKYIKKNIQIKNNNTVCSINSITLIEDEAYKILTDGLWVNYNFDCWKSIEKLDISIKYFLEFPLQTNRFTLHNISQWFSNSETLVYKVLTSKIYQYDINVLNKEIIESKDSDNDGLSDEDEKIYQTNPQKLDTDGDNYSDKEEIEYGWDPINPDLWPGQLYREKLDIEISQKKIDALSEIDNNIKNQNLSDYGYGNNYLKSTMKYINDFFTKNEWNVFIIFLIIFWLWVLHAIWPGHSKSLLIAYTLEKDNGYKKGLIFALIFTITHILDIIALFFITKVIITFVDPSKYNYYIQVISWIILFFLSIYLIYRAIQQKRNLEKNKNSNNKQSLFIAFLAWLAPCSFAWSIFLLLIALGKSQWVILLVFALGLGIFTTLCVVVITTVFLKNRVYHKIQFLAQYSTIFSAIIIFIISFILLLKII